MYLARLAVITLFITAAACGSSKAEDEDVTAGALTQGQEAALYNGSCSVGWFANADDAKAGKSTAAFIEGTFHVADDGSVTAGTEPLVVSIGQKGRKDQELKIKSGKVIDAKKNIGELTVTAKVAGVEFDAKLHYDRSKKALEVSSERTGTLSLPGSCTFTGEDGRELGAEDAAN